MPTTIRVGVVIAFTRSVVQPKVVAMEARRTAGDQAAPTRIGFQHFRPDRGGGRRIDLLFAGRLARPVVGEDLVALDVEHRTWHRQRRRLGLRGATVGRRQQDQLVDALGIERRPATGARPALRPARSG